MLVIFTFHIIKIYIVTR
ncbi:hypothetical protein [Agaribacterium sp. ZY112]